MEQTIACESTPSPTGSFADVSRANADFVVVIQPKFADEPPIFCGGFWWRLPLC